MFRHGNEGIRNKGLDTDWRRVVAVEGKCVGRLMK
jgi:hypothetical protein